MNKLLMLLLLLPIYFFSSCKAEVNQRFNCPMHTDFIQNKPGKCNICGMDLVKMKSETKTAKEWICPMHPEIHDTKKSSCPKCGMDLVKKEEAQQASEIWRCPMHPEIHDTKPGACSKCGMDLVKDDAAEQSAVPVEGYGEVSMDEQQIRILGVKTVQVQVRSLTRIIRTVGSAAHDGELYAASEEYRAARTFLKTSKGGEGEESARTLLRNAVLKLQLMGFEQKEIDSMANASSDFLIRPEKHKLYVLARIYENDILRVYRGQKALIHVRAAGDVKMDGTVISVSKIIDPMTRSYFARIKVEHAGLVPHEAAADIELLADEGEHLSIEDDAVMDTGLRSIVFVLASKGRFVPAEVIVSENLGGYRRVLSGLKDGEVVASGANFLLDSESRLRALRK